MSTATPHAGIRTLPLCATALVAAVVLTAGCGALAPLERLVQPPRFEQAAGRPAELRLMPPSRANPAGGAGVTIWLRVTNPNPFGFTISTLETTLLLEGSRAASGAFPLGLPLGARQEAVVPIDLSIRFDDVPPLAEAGGRLATGRAVSFQLDGVVGIDVGRLGRPTFGPMVLARGEFRPFR